jgi:RNA polymerase sigma-70 factor (ECF subfamily)
MPRPNGTTMTPSRVLDDRQGEQDLIERLQDGDEQAFAALVQRYQTHMLNLARRLVGSHAVAEEVVQDAWLGVIRGIDRFAGRSSLRTWLFNIVVNRARSTGAKEHRASTVPAPEALEDGWPSSSEGAREVALPHWSDEVDDRLTAASLAAPIREAITMLPPTQREVVLLRDVSGFSSAEVCGLLSIKDTHQRVLLHRGRGAVRRIIETEELKHHRSHCLI